MRDLAARIGFEIAGWALFIGMIIVAALAYVHIEKRYNQWAAMAGSLAVFVALVIVFGPALSSLNEASCELADDYAKCISDE